MFKNGQARETGNIGYTRHKKNTNKTENTTQYALDTTIWKQTQITYTRHESSYDQLEVNTGCYSKLWNIMSLYLNTS